jgi:hypothetical protein
VSSYDKARYAAAFAKGLTETTSYLNGLNLDQLRLTAGAVSTTAATGSGQPVTPTTYTTKVLNSGGPDDPVAAFQGAVAFNINVQRGATTRFRQCAPGLGRVKGCSQVGDATLQAGAEARAVDKTFRRLGVGVIGDREQPPIVGDGRGRQPGLHGQRTACGICAAAAGIAGLSLGLQNPAHIRLEFARQPPHLQILRV